MVDFGGVLGDEKTLCSVIILTGFAQFYRHGRQLIVFDRKSGNHFWG